MKKKYSYVEWIQNNEITIFCYGCDKIKKLKLMHAKRKLLNLHCWIVNYQNDRDLATIISFLRDNDFLFSFDEHGWCPSGIFQHLRERGLVSGKCMEISWKGRNMPKIREI